jgi:hypothetical protein
VESRGLSLGDEVMHQFALPAVPDLLEHSLDAATGQYPPLADSFIREAPELVLGGRTIVFSNLIIVETAIHPPFIM